MLPRRFALVRHVDYTGVSGVGVVAYGVTFADGHVVLRWRSTHPATSMWSSVEDLLAIHGHGEATSIEWIDAPHGDLEEFSVSSSRGRRARRRAGRASTPAPVVATTDDVPATHATDPAGIPAAAATDASQPAAAEPAVALAAVTQPAAESGSGHATARSASVQPAEAESARDDDQTVMSDPVRSATADSVTDRTGSLHEADPIHATQNAESVNSVDDTHPVPEPTSEPARETQRSARERQGSADELKPSSEALAGSAGPESTTEVERPRPQSTPGASPDRTDELAATQAWPAWADVTGSESDARPAASLPVRPPIRDVRQESSASGPGRDRWAEPKAVQRMEPSARDDPESTDPFASVLSEEPPEFPGRNNGNQHVDTITGLLDLPADLVENSRSADSRTTDSRPEPAPRQLRRAGRHRRDDD